MSLLRALSSMKMIEKRHFDPAYMATGVTPPNDRPGTSEKRGKTHTPNTHTGSISSRNLYYRHEHMRLSKVTCLPLLNSPCL